MRVLWLGSLASAFVVCALACSSSSKPRASGDTPDGGGLKLDASGGSSGGDANPGADGGGTDAPGKEGSGSDGTAGDAGDEGPPGPPICHDDFTWSAITRVASIAGAGFDRFGSVSADELTVVWSDAAGDIFYADRLSTSDDFGAAAPVTSTVALANDRVAIDPTGLELIATLADGSSFTTLERLERGKPWQAGASVPDQFANIESTLSLGASGSVSNPVISADGSSFFFVASGAVGASGPVLYEAVWDQASGSWGFPSSFPNAELMASAVAQEKRPTGASADDRTLFFFDEGAGRQRAAWRGAPTSPFDEFVDLPALPEAVPSGDCTTVYFRGSDDAGAGLFVGSAE
jgi:hypothetical protein